MATKFLTLKHLLAVLMLSQMCSCQNIEINVGIEYNNEDCGTNYSVPRELNLTLPSGSTAIDVMEGAANISRSYQFGVTFLGEMGYRIDVINGTQSNETCQWHLYIGVLNETGTLSQLHYILPDNVTNAVLHYTTIQRLPQPLALKPTVGGKNLTVYYIIEYEDVCNNGTIRILQPLEVVISKGETALHVLENAMLIANESEYQFASTYFGSLGYHVHTINGISSTFGIAEVPCYWSFLTKEPNSDSRVTPEVGVAHYVIPGNNYTITMRYTNDFYPIDDGPTDGHPSFRAQNMPLVCALLLASLCLVIFC